ncbi:MAG: methionine synthase [Syntrophaceae bacterium]|nr:methionine synthase [Syntrophaceae bacterium]
MQDAPGRPWPVTVFDAIPLRTPVREIYRRLGWRSGRTELPDDRRQEVDRQIREAESLIRLRGAARRIPLLRLESGRTVLAGGEALESTKLSRLLTGCPEILLMAATAGGDIVAEASRDTATGSATRGVVLDAAASEITDAALDWIAAWFNGTLLREGRRLLKRRYSPGYGDLALESQRILFDLLELDRIGISLTDHSLLVPEKSVIALTGILPGTEPDHDR